MLGSDRVCQRINLSQSLYFPFQFNLHDLIRDKHHIPEAVGTPPTTGHVLNNTGSSSPIPKPCKHESAQYNICTRDLYLPQPFSFHAVVIHSKQVFSCHLKTLFCRLSQTVWHEDFPTPFQGLNILPTLCIFLSRFSPAAGFLLLLLLS